MRGYGIKEKDWCGLSIVAGIIAMALMFLAGGAGAEGKHRQACLHTQIFPIILSRFQISQEPLLHEAFDVNFNHFR